MLVLLNCLHASSTEVQITRGKNNAMGERSISSTVGTGTTEFPHAKELISTPTSHYMEKLTQNG